ncbi:MAG: DUF2188 domain-containing protein [Rhizobiales bacterium]|nr:DUF2188 domain-containing protein [Hyphomicrobiales bacterium]
MARPQLRDHGSVQPILPAQPRKLYWIERQADLWVIRFDGQDFGPYKSDQEALLFAVDAAKKLHEQGEDTQVLVMDETGDIRAAWTSEQDAYPPRP